MKRTSENNFLRRSGAMAVALLGIAIFTPIAANAQGAASSSDPTKGVATSTNPTVPETEPTDSIEGPTITDLEDLVVEGQRPVVEVEAGKLNYNVDEDPTAANSTILDLLRKVPGVSVDGNDNITLYGKGDFKITIDGKEEPMLRQYASMIFKNMPASMISRIEVISQPGAKYDAEGVGGVLNIVTQRDEIKRNDGYNGRISLNFGKQSPSLSLYGMVKHNKVTVNLNAAYSDGNIFPQTNESNNVVEYHSSDMKGSLVDEGKQKIGYRYIMAGTNMSWEPNSKNLFNVGFNYMFVPIGVKEITNRQRFLSPTGGELWHTVTSMQGSKLKNASYTANASYQHNFSGDKNDLVLSYQYSLGRNLQDFRSRFTELSNIVYPYESQINRSDAINREHTVQIDYANNFNGSRHLLETGGKGIFRRNGGYDSSSYFNGEGNGIPEMDSNSSIRQIQNVMALYASYTGTFGNLTAKGGLRYENTLMGIDFLDLSRPDFRSRLNDVVPNATVNWKFDAATNLDLTYQMRISRPSLSQVNPFEQNIKDNFVQTGNPDLDSERNHNLTLTFTKFGRALGGNVGISGSKTSNAIANYTYLDNGVVYSTNRNIGDTETAALFGFINWNIIPRMTLNLNARLEYLHLNSPAIGMSNHGWNTNLSLGWNWRTDRDYIFSAYGTWSNHRATLQGWSGGWHYYMVSAGKDLLADKSLNITLSASNFLEDRNKWESFSQTADMTTRNCYRNPMWNVSVSVSWSFGNIKGDVKKTSNAISNDDMVKEGNDRSGAKF